MNEHPVNDLILLRQLKLPFDANPVDGVPAVIFSAPTFNHNSQTLRTIRTVMTDLPLRISTDSLSSLLLLLPIMIDNEQNICLFFSAICFFHFVYRFQTKKSENNLLEFYFVNISMTRVHVCLFLHLYTLTKLNCSLLFVLIFVLSFLAQVFVNSMKLAHADCSFVPSLPHIVILIDLDGSF